MAGMRCTPVERRASLPSPRQRAKLYTVSQGSSLIYVGIATRRMSTRITHGFTATGKSGYHGYKWKTLTGSLWLSVWTGLAKDDVKEALLEMETIEAEVAFLCRQRAGQWPAFQQEIHFSQSLQRHRDDAERVYTHATRGQRG